jgi:hypothetical protein
MPADPQRLLDLGAGLEIWKVDVDGLIEQDVNARSMPASMFERLAETIGRDQRLESLPLVAQTDRGLEIVSGHHRTRAARAQALTEIHVIVDTTGLDADAIKAKQLAHNAIYGAIADVDRRLEAYMPESVVGETPAVQIPSIDLTLDYRTVTILFLPHQHETFERALEQASSTLTSDLERLHVSQREVFDEFRTALDKVRRNYDVRSSGAALAQEREAVPVFDLLGTSTIPSEAAAVIDRAIGTMEQRGEITRTGRWRALELLCADYLAG